MKSYLFLIIIVSGIVVISSFSYANSWIPPTNAFDKIHSDNGTINAVNSSMPLNIKGGIGINVDSSNLTHTLTISSSVGSGTGSYNTTQANNVNINSGGYKINFINGTGATVHLQNSGAGNQVNVTVSATGTSSGVSSLNALTGALTIACVSGNTTCTTSGGNTITVNTGNNLAYLAKFNNFTNDNSIDGHKLKTSTEQIRETNVAGTSSILVEPQSGNTLGSFAIAPSGTQSALRIFFMRTSDYVTNFEDLVFGTDIFGTGQYNIDVRTGGNGTLRPLIVSMQNTKLLSFDVANTITSYVQNIWTPISDPVTAFTNAIWKSSTTTDVLKYRNNANTTTYNLVSTLSATNATRGQLSGNGTGTTSASMVMDGVYATITPANTGRITVHVTGVAADSVATDGCNIGIRQSTSNMGANGAAVAGTILGDNFQSTSATAAAKVPFSRIYDFSGTINTKYFFDLSFARVTGGTCTLTSVNWDLVEH